MSNYDNYEIMIIFYFFIFIPLLIEKKNKNLIYRIYFSATCS